MTGEEALRAMLAAIQEKSGEIDNRDYFYLKPLESVMRKVLGQKEPDNRPSPTLPQLARPEFPQWRVKYSASGEELGRRRVNSLEEWSQLSKAEPGFNYVMPIEEGQE